MERSKKVDEPTDLVSIAVMAVLQHSFNNIAKCGQMLEGNLQQGKPVDAHHVY